MSNYAHATCPTCGWSVLLPALELAAIGGCRACGGPLEHTPSPLPWHGPLRAENPFKRR